MSKRKTSIFAGDVVWNPHMLKSSVSIFTHFDEFFTVLWSANHLVELTGQAVLCVSACVCVFPICMCEKGGC